MYYNSKIDSLISRLSNLLAQEFYLRIHMFVRYYGTLLQAAYGNLLLLVENRRPKRIINSTNWKDKNSKILFDIKTSAQQDRLESEAKEIDLAVKIN